MATTTSRRRRPGRILPGRRRCHVRPTRRYAAPVTDPSAGPGPAEVAAAVLAHPAVLRLDGGPFGSIATYLPGARLRGVRLPAPGEPGPAEIAVVVALGVPFAGIADDIAERVRRTLGDPDLRVEVTVADVGVTGPVAAG